MADDRSHEGFVSFLPVTRRDPIEPEMIGLLAKIANLAIPPEDFPTLAALLGDQLAWIEVLDRLDLTDVAPALHFDPRWHD